MALQLGNLRDALIEAGASEEKARLAAEEVAAYEGQMTAARADIAGLRTYVDQQIAAVRADIAGLRTYVDQQIAAVRADIAGLRTYVDQQIVAVRADIAALRSYVDLRLERVEGRLNLLTWMVGFVIAIQVAMFVKLFVHG